MMTDKLNQAAAAVTEWQTNVRTINEKIEIATAALSEAKTCQTVPGNPRAFQFYANQHQQIAGRRRGRILAPAAGRGSEGRMISCMRWFLESLASAAVTAREQRPSHPRRCRWRKFRPRDWQLFFEKDDAPMRNDDDDLEKLEAMSRYS
jgi:hypothetical protein